MKSQLRSAKSTVAELNTALDEKAELLARVIEKWSLATKEFMAGRDVTPVVKGKLWRESKLGVSVDTDAESVSFMDFAPVREASTGSPADGDDGRCTPPTGTCKKSCQTGTALWRCNAGAGAGADMKKACSWQD